jgi:type I restriction enzyme M protein
MTNQTASLPATLRAIRARLDLTQEQLAERLGVSFATVNRWEGGDTKPQRAVQEAILALAREAGVEEVAEVAPETAVQVSRRRSRRAAAATPTTKPMEQMLWDAACSIRGEKDAAKFKDYRRCCF